MNAGHQENKKNCRPDLAFGRFPLFEGMDACTQGAFIKAPSW